MHIHNMGCCRSRPRRAAVVITVVVFALLSLGHLASGDVIVLKNGEKLSGRVLGRTKDETVVKLDSGETRKIPTAEVDRVVKREPAKDPNNLFHPSWLNGAGDVVPKGSWDGSDAVRSRGGYPSFNVPLYEDRLPVFEKIRGQWVKIYMDTKGGKFDLTVMDLATRDYRWFTCTRSPDKKEWGRISHTFRVPSQELARPIIYFYNMSEGLLYDNLRVYILGTEPPELTAPIDEVWNPNLKNLVQDASFETLGEAAVLPTGWHLAKGGARIAEDNAHTGNRSMLLMSDSVVKTPKLEAEKGVQLVVHFWARGRGNLTAGTLDLDSVGVPLKAGLGDVGQAMARRIPMSDKWVKIELTSRSQHPDCRGRQIIFSTLKDSEIFIDDVQILRDAAVFPQAEKQRNPFKGEFAAAGGKVETTLNGKPAAEMAAGITGPTVLMLKVTPDQAGGAVRVTGGLTFEDGGFVGPDRYWKMTTATPPENVTQLDYDDSSWKPAPLAPDGKALVVAARGPVWLRRAILWNTTPYLVPRVVQLPFDVGRADWFSIALAPPVPLKISSYQLLVDVPRGYRVVPYTATCAAYLFAPRKLEELPGGAEHNGVTYRRFAATYDPGRITGVAGTYRGRGAVISTVLLEHLGGKEPVAGKLYLTRVTNGNAVDLPVEVELVRVPLDGTRPEKIMVHDLWTNPYTVGNPPNAQLNIEAVDRIVETCIRSGMTHSGWPTASGRSGNLYVNNPKYGPRWISFLKKKNVVLMPQYHNFPFGTRPGMPTYEIAKRSPGAIIQVRKREQDGKEVIRYVNVSFGWLLSDASREYWQALREEYRQHAAKTEADTGMKVSAFVWDHEFEVRSYCKADDPLARKLFAERAKIDPVPDWPTIEQKYSGQWYHFSRWACRRVVQRTYEDVIKPLGLSFHVYFGEGRPFDKGNCDIISSYRIGQNVSGQIKSVAQEYKAITEGLAIDPNIRFLGILQAEIQAVHRGRPFHWQEFRNNCVKRAIATHGGGICIYTEVEPQCPGLPYGTAAASRIIAKWEPYFVKPDPVFAGEELDEIVKIDPKPADVALLRKDGKGLLILFGGEPESQTDTVKLTLTFADGKHTEIDLPPMGIKEVEIDL